MIRSVTFEKTTYNELPYKFEAGTPNIAGAIGLGAAIDYLERPRPGARRRPRARAAGATRTERAVGDPRRAPHRHGARRRPAWSRSSWTACIPHDVGTILDQEGIAVRTGHHCAQPVMERFGVPATARASLALYNTREDDRRPGAGACTRSRRCSAADVRPARALPGGDPRPQQAAAELPRAGRARGRPRATTRCAATRSPSSSSWTATASQDVGFQGKGCAISTASASMMTETPQGQDAGGGGGPLRALP